MINIRILTYVMVKLGLYALFHACTLKSPFSVEHAKYALKCTFKNFNRQNSPYPTFRIFEYFELSKRNKSCG